MITLPQLPYAYNALEPAIDARTMEIHHTKHHQTYVDTLNKALAKHPELGEDVPALLKDLSNVPEAIRTAVRNHGGGHVNHSFFWQIVSPQKQECSGTILQALTTMFGSLDAFKEQFTTAALGRFGSGWAWLVLDGKKLAIVTTANQDSPFTEGKIPLLGLDVWEHAYYLQYQQKRAEYVKSFWTIVNWKRVEEHYTNGMK